MKIASAPDDAIAPHAMNVSRKNSRLIQGRPKNRREDSLLIRGSQFSKGRNSPKWMREVNRKMRFGRIVVRGAALRPSFRERVRTLGSPKGETALREAFTTAWRRMPGSREHRFQKKRNIAFCRCFPQYCLPQISTGAHRFQRHAFCSWTFGTSVGLLSVGAGATTRTFCLLKTLPCTGSSPNTENYAPWRGRPP